MAIVNKNFRVKNGLIVDGTVATVNGYNVLTEASTAFIINTIGGSADSANTPNAIVKRDGSGNFAAGTITATFSGNLTGNVTGTVSSLSNHNTNDLAEGSSNLYFTNSRALAATAAAYDAAGAANTAQANSATYTDGKISTEVTNRNSAISSAISTEVANRNTAIATAKSEAINTSESYTDSSVSSLHTTVTFEIDTAKSEAIGTSESYTDSAIYTEISDRNSAIATAKSEAITTSEAYADAKKAEAISTSEGYTDTKVADLVNGAPALLDTLKELADAIGDNPNYATDLATSVGSKVAKSGDTMTGDLSFGGTKKVKDLAAPTQSGDAATKGYVDSAVTTTENYTDSSISTLHTSVTSEIATAKSQAITTSESYTDTAISTEVSSRNSAISTAVSGEVTARNTAIATAKSEAITAAESYSDAATAAVLNGTTKHTAVNVNDISSIQAATVSVASASTVNAITWDASAYRTAKAIVKFKNGVNTHVSEVLLTLDTNNNIAVTEFGTVTTNGDLGAISAGYVSGNVSIAVTTTYASTDVMVYATLIK
jgi:hypothetical protein